MSREDDVGRSREVRWRGGIVPSGRRAERRQEVDGRARTAYIGHILIGSVLGNGRERCRRYPVVRGQKA